VAPEDRNRSGKLREVERRAVGKDIASRSGGTFLPELPMGFRGRLQRTESGLEGASVSHLVVSDGSRFGVLRASASLRGIEGKAVVVTRDAKGRVLVRPIPGKDLGI
jgi:hypothetical protein